MLGYLIAFFVLVMAGGVGFAIRDRREPRLPLKLSVVHGTLGVAAIVLLAMFALNHPGDRPLNLSILVFILTALGGLMLFAFRASKQRLPLAVVLLHAAFALCGLALLFVGWSRVH
jgi:membrane protease YdiL (CAAX protease family)